MAAASPPATSRLSLTAAFVQMRRNTTIDEVENTVTQIRWTMTPAESLRVDELLTEAREGRMTLDAVKDAIETLLQSELGGRRRRRKTRAKRKHFRKRTSRRT